MMDRLHLLAVHNPEAVLMLRLLAPVVTLAPRMKAEAEAWRLAVADLEGGFSTGLGRVKSHTRLQAAYAVFPVLTTAYPVPIVF